MSQRKDDRRTNSTKKLATGLSKTTTKTQDETGIKKKTKKMEDPNKTVPTKSNPAADKLGQAEAMSSSRDKYGHLTRKVPSSKFSTDVARREKSKLDITGTQSSNRISKSVFYPSKSMYANALKAHKITTSENQGSIRKLKEGSSTDKAAVDSSRKKYVSSQQPKSKSVKPDKLRVNDVTKDSSRLKKNSKTMENDSRNDTTSERPRTATLKKSTIPNLQVSTQDVSEMVTSKNDLMIPISKSDDGSEKYEDDFESYESDFEAYSSSSSNLGNISGEETSSVSSSEVSGPRDLGSTVRSAHSAETEDERKMDSGHFDMTDYRYKHMLNNINESIEKENSQLYRETERNNPTSLSDEGFEEQKSLQFINFLDAKRKNDHFNSMRIKKKRGEVLLNMIKLDIYSFILFDLAPVPYEKFIKNYGNVNTVQSACQTGEDNVEDETQTDDTSMHTKWTQNPTFFPKTNSGSAIDWRAYIDDYLGVGDVDFVRKETNITCSNTVALNKFLISAGRLVCDIFSQLKADKNININSCQNVPFSKGFLEFNTNNNFTKNTSVTCVSFCCDNKNLISVHLGTEDRTSVILIWDVYNTDEPLFVYRTYGRVSRISCDDHYIFAGLYDGTISIWPTVSSRTTERGNNCSPLYSTFVGFGHYSRIVGLQHLKLSNNLNVFAESYHSSIEICSLDEEGDIILWSVINKEATDTASNIILAKNSHLSLKSLYSELTDLGCTDLIVNADNSALISTNYGYIIHYFMKGGRSNVKLFSPGYQSIVKCMESCPFSEDYFLAGFENGDINMYSRLVAKPLIILSNKEVEAETSCSTQLIQWSKTRPFTIFTKDLKNNIHIWNLNESDMFPVYTIPFEKDVTCMELSSPTTSHNNRKLHCYMLIGTKNGEVIMHILNDEYGLQLQADYEKDLNTFLDYVHRL